MFMTAVFTRLPADFLFMGVLSVLFLTGVLDTHEALSGFASEGMITVGMLYVVVAGLQSTATHVAPRLTAQDGPTTH